MKKPILSVKAIAFVFILNVVAGVSAFAQTGSTTFNGLPVLRSATISSPTLDVVFGYSNYDGNNAFIINGITVPLLNSGWFNNAGQHSATNQNYVCGFEYGTIFNNFFAVDLSNLSSHGITPPITSVVLHVNRYESVPASGTFDYKLFNVTNSYATINQDYNPSDATGIAIHNDLGNGTMYADVVLDKTMPNNTYIDIPLNSAGIAAMNAAIGSTFVVGGTGSPNAIVVPVPYWAIALVFLAIGLLVVIRFRRRQFAA
ncbi:hypothetical protein INQ51_13900 [Maribellus sp. CM-23]|uniref:hypothetical protein n=1 Tax=Maribellus sp. CM-23 TaxID=2781026 RepID=UPI001F354272|nr:hypothetical protein [Maribellus sp. CM-23]MCE4565407.1 hypothetical protein [Maribellus sp. CM-23]